MDTFRTLRREGFKKPSHGNHPSLCYFTVEGLPYDDITILMLTLKYWCRHLNADVDIEILTLKLTLKCWHWNTDVDIEILILTLKYRCWHWYRNDIEILTFIFFRGCQPVPFSKSLGTSLLLHGLRFRNSVIAVSYFTIHCILLRDLHFIFIWSVVQNPAVDKYFWQRSSNHFSCSPLDLTPSLEPSKGWYRQQGTSSKISIVSLTRP